MERFVGLVRRHGLDLALVLLIVNGVLEVVDRGASPPVPDTIGALAVVAMALPLFVRRQFPFAAPVLAWVSGMVFSFLDPAFITTSFTLYMLGAIAAYLLGNLGDTIRSRIGLVVTLVGSVVVVANSPTSEAADFVTIPATFAAAWLAGYAFRSRVDRAEQAEERAAAAERDRESVARIAVAEERSRITRELHDIVAHAVSVMVLQVGAVRHRLPDTLSDDKEALRSVEEAGRGALSEMRRLLGALSDEQTDADLSPQPGLDRLEALVEEVRLAGMDVALHIEGSPSPLPRAIDLSAYRVVQEGLTNSLRHSGANHADVRVRYGTDHVRIDVLDNGVGSTVSDGMGRGLTGIRERVKIYGGDMSAGPGPDGGFLLRVRFPLAGHPS